MDASSQLDISVLLTTDEFCRQKQPVVGIGVVDDVRTSTRLELAENDFISSDNRSVVVLVVGLVGIGGRVVSGKYNYVIAELPIR